MPIRKMLSYCLAEVDVVVLSLVGKQALIA